MIVLHTHPTTLSRSREGVVVFARIGPLLFSAVVF